MCIRDRCKTTNYYRIVSPVFYLHTFYARLLSGSNLFTESAQLTAPERLQVSAYDSALTYYIARDSIVCSFIFYYCHFAPGDIATSFGEGIFDWAEFVGYKL